MVVKANEKTNGITRFMKARVEFGNITKNKDNPYFSSKYVDLAGVIEHTFPTLASHDILVQQTLAQVFNVDDGVSPIGCDFGFVLNTVIYDAVDGSTIDSMTYPIVCKDYRDPQKVGGALTYARRYSLLTILGLAAEDDDGNLAAQPAKESKSPKSSGASVGDLRKQVQVNYGVETAEDLQKLTTKVFGEEGAVTTFAALDAKALNTILNFENGAPM